jgi:membrane associated rhomboid family serine protease
VSSLGNVSLSFVVPSRMIFLMWLIFFIEMQYGIDLSMFGVLPRVPLGLIGIITGPLLHGSLMHLVSNTFPLLILGVTLYFFYGRMARDVFLYSYFVPGFLIWVFGRQIFHIGASGLIYGIASFLFFSGIVRTELRSLLIGIITAIAYGGLIWGVFPTNHLISWESHLAGAVVGGVVAFWYKSKKIK